eukprot:Gregarina_sp_Poly_1__4605@NODE_2467_length_2082_cov_217_117122_g1562_i0_p1_GENE_NODE_2467_length_2082_cov_217_117122_g1562_i0NODE_2467_length_2082_cov_217_117122_g1562_i0_p1_ORF_typecomplete_len285_score34_99Ribosomal_L1/PF00687_21/5_3e35MtmB/PF05369_12/0_23_NODE_2467_length_2082_cov_217_117122_g1562_i011221976
MSREAIKRPQSSHSPPTSKSSKQSAKKTKNSLALAKAAKLIRAYQTQKRRHWAEDGSAPIDITDENKASFYVQFSLSRSVENPELKPTLIPLPYPPRDLGIAEVCLIVKNPQRFWKDKVASEQHKLPMISKVIDFEHLVKKYPQPKDRREILNSYDVFLADRRLVHLLPSHLGKVFRDSNKMPLPVKLEGTSSIAAPILEALQCTTLLMKPGTTVSVRIGDQSLTNEQLATNAEVVTAALQRKLNLLNSTESNDVGSPSTESLCWKIFAASLHLSQSLSIPIIL